MYKVLKFQQGKSMDFFNRSNEKRTHYEVMGEDRETVPGVESWTKARERLDLPDKEGENKQLYPNLHSFVHLIKKS